MTRGVRAFDLTSYMEQYKEALAWAEHIEAIAKRNGVGLTWASFGAAALSDKLFRDEKTEEFVWKETWKRLEQESPDKAEAERLVKEEAELLAKNVQDLVARSNESNVPEEQPRFGPEAMLQAIGMGDSEPQDKLLLRVAWEQKQNTQQNGLQY